MVLLAGAKVSGRVQNLTDYDNARLPARSEFKLDDTVPQGGFVGWVQR